MPVLPNKLAEFAQAKYGLSPDELYKLFESLGRVNEHIKVARRRKVAGKEYSKQIGGRKPFMIIADAVDYENKRRETRLDKDEKIRDLIEDVDFDELMVRLEVNDSIYPKRLTPADIVAGLASATGKLEDLDRLRAIPHKTYSPREEAVLDALTWVKRQEPFRIARRIAERQRDYILNHSVEELEAEYNAWLRNLRGEPPLETDEERLKREEMERLAAEAANTEEERIAATEGARIFNDLANLHTLLDDVASIVQEKPDAAAAIVRQWIGNEVLTENK
jgi:hypothetical protein